MTTKKTRREMELETDRNWYLFFLGLFIVLTTVLIGINIYKNADISKLETQLSECQEQGGLHDGLIYHSSFDGCQEQVEVWTLDVVCYGYFNYKNIQFQGTEIRFQVFPDSYKDYKEVLDNIKDLENCEVLE